MAQFFHPKVGMVLMCDFQGFQPPEINKRRPVVVVGEEMVGRQGTCIVVPLSSRAPDPIMPFHHMLDPTALPHAIRKRSSWAKCDLVTTVACWRLDRLRVGQDALGKRLYASPSIRPEDLLAVRRAVLAALHLTGLVAFAIDSET